MAVLLLEPKVDKLADRHYESPFIVDSDYDDILVTVSINDNVLSCTLTRYEVEYLSNFLNTYLKQNI